MNRISKRLLSTLCAAALILGLMPLGALAATPEHTLWIVGDSTVCDYAADEDKSYFYKRCGYGTALKDYVDDTYAVQNLAVSGQSSKSFPLQKSDQYAQLTGGIQAGDVLLIGFGHNDEKNDDPARYTAPNGTSTTEGSFAKSLTDNYIKVAKDAGATPILCTPIVRRPNSEGSWSGDKLHQANGGDYAKDIRDLGAELGVSVIDMTTLTKDKYDAVGYAESANFHAWLASKSTDNTHLNAYGAQVVAQILAGEIAKLTSLDIAGHIDAAKVSASLDKAALLVQNPDWVDPATLPYAPPTTQSEQCQPYVAGKATFYGTAMGDLGGSASATNHVRETVNGAMHIAVKNNKGKISSTVDGIVMYYYAVPAGKPFTLQAKAHVSAVDTANNQGGFGLMARDDMYIDQSLKDGLTTFNSSYVAAGSLSNGPCANFARKDGALVKSSQTLAKAIAADKSYDLSITRSVDGNYSCSIDGVATTYDYSIDVIDTAYTYIGMFCARNMDVTYSDITLVVDGETLSGNGQQPDDPDAPDDPTPAPVEGFIAGGWFESLFAELADVSDADVTAVKWSGAAEGALTGGDLEYLVRDAGDGVRIDVPGLKAGTYDLTVTIKGKDYIAKGVEVKAHDRSGFAHYNYTEGVGAYNDDGTLKPNATVLYVTEETKDTVSLTVKDGSKDITVSGIGNILNSKGWRINHSGEKPLQKMASAGRPLVVRVIGKVTQPEGVTAWGSTGNGGNADDNGGMCIMEYASNITIEGIGPDATVDGWGFSFNAGGTGMGSGKTGGKNFEVRNVTFKNVPEDCIGIQGELKNGAFDSPAEHIWVHNNAFYGPHGLPDASQDQDKAEGDGAVDFVNSQYMTMSYNYFEDYHKTSLIGSGKNTLQYHVTWHHNHWKDVQSRSPLVRKANVHIYNNFYDGQTSYCMSLRGNSYIFSEYNAFENCKSPVVNENDPSKGDKDGLGGVCKSYQDVFTKCDTGAGKNDATVVTDKTQTVASGCLYANFDTDPDSYVSKGDYQLDASVQTAKANIAANGGVMKAAAGMTTVTMTAVGTPSGPDEPTVDKTRLDQAIATAEAAISNIYTVSDDVKVSDVNRGVKFITESDKATYNAALSAAKSVSANVSATQTEVDAAVASLTEAAKLIKAGTKYTGGSSSSSGGGGGSSSSRPANTTTDANGNKTTTKTDAKGTKTVIVEAADGSKVETVTTKAGDVTLSVLTPKGEKQVEIKLPATVPAPEEKFTDVPEGHWAESAINTMAGLGVVGGVSQEAAIFDMTSPVTRGSVATILFRFSNGAVGMTSSFADVESGAWYSDAVGWATATGVVTGYSDNAFGPKDTITRQQMAVMLSRFAKLIGLDTSADKAPLAQFSDGAKTGIWAMDGVAWCVKMGILQGKGGNVLDPAAEVSRAEMAVMFNRMIELIK